MEEREGGLSGNVVSVVAQRELGLRDALLAGGQFTRRSIGDLDLRRGEVLIGGTGEGFQSFCQEEKRDNPGVIIFKELPSRALDQEKCLLIVFLLKLLIFSHEACT